jgi:hypothetical protein
MVGSNIHFGYKPTSFEMDITDSNSIDKYVDKIQKLSVKQQNIKKVKDKVEKSILLKKLLDNNNYQIVNQDIKGNYHFNGNFHNANDLKEALLQLANQQDYKSLVNNETELVLQIFEDVFNHKAFTGRSGTFYGYEGLGSIYWHMVSKLHVAVLEVIETAVESNENEATIKSLITHFDAVGAGIGVHKSPQVYGAFPTDPYSHTPFNKGAQQPGMTGQVKEDILTRIGELGVKLKGGQLHFQPNFLLRNEFLTQEIEATFVLVDGTKKSLTIPKNSMAFTVCQVPVIYKIAATNHIELYNANGSKETLDSLKLSKEQSTKIFLRSGEISQVVVYLDENNLR